MRPGPGSNSRPLDLQSDWHLLQDTLPTGLLGPVFFKNFFKFIYTVESTKFIEIMQLDWSGSETEVNMTFSNSFGRTSVNIWFVSLPIMLRFAAFCYETAEKDF